MPGALTQRVAAFAFVALLAAASMPSTTAADEPSNGALDPIGDVYPTAWVASLPGSVEHAELYDLASFQVKHESKDDFVFEIQVGDLPDDWILQAAPPGGHPLPPVQVSGGVQVPALPSDFLDNKVSHSVYFTIDGKAYVAVASLGEFNLNNPNAFPSVQSTVYLKSLLQSVQAKIAATKSELQKDQLGPLWTTPLKQSTLNLLTYAGENVTEIQTTIGEPCSQAAAQDPVDTSSQAAACQSAYREQFTQVQDAVAMAQDNSGVIPGSAGDVIDAKFQDLMAAVDTSKATFDLLPSAFFQGSGAAPGLSSAPSVSTSPSLGVGNAPALPQAPSVVLFHRFVLYKIDAGGNRTKATDLGGVVDLQGNAIRMTVKKADVGAQKDMKLTKFHVEAAFKGTRVDYAPDALAGNPTPQQAPFAILAQQVVTPAFGKDYMFAADTYQPPAGGPDVLMVRIQLSPIGPATAEIQPGGSATYYVTLKNVAQAALTGYFSLGPDAEGWTSQVSEPVWSLGAGASQTFTVTVAAVAGGASEHVTHLMASVDGGESASTDFRTTMNAPPADHAGVGGEKKAKKGGVPGFESVALLSALAALLVVARRRFG